MEKRQLNEPVKTQEVLFRILRQQVCMQQPGSGQQPECGQDAALPAAGTVDAGALYALARRHDMAHFLSSYLQTSCAPASEEEDPENVRLREAAAHARDAAVYRYLRQDMLKTKLYTALNREGIPFVPLKGLVLRGLYPEPWMRTSCDLDLLVREDDLGRAETVLTDAGFAVQGGRNYHDISFRLGDLHVELHFSIRENQPCADPVLDRVWDYAEPAEGTEYRLRDSYFRFYHLAHMCGHVVEGGCGIRPVLDWYLLTRGDASDPELDALLAEGGLSVFRDRITALARVWFEGTEASDGIRELERYLLTGGAYGSEKANGAVASAYRRGKWTRALRLLFPDFPSMCQRYPVLRRHPVLLPVCYVRRLLRKLIRKRGTSARKLQNVLSQNPEALREASGLLAMLGLDGETPIRNDRGGTSA